MPILIRHHKRLEADRWISREGGIWEYKLAGIMQCVFGMVKFIYNEVPNLPVETLTFVQDGLNYLSSESSYAEMRDTPGSSFYNKDTYALQCNFADFNGGNLIGRRSHIGRTIMIGIIVGYCDRVDYTREDKSIYSGVFHAPRLKSIPSMPQKCDDLFHDISTYNDWTLTYINTDGEFDSEQPDGDFIEMIRVPSGKKLASLGYPAGSELQHATAIACGIIGPWNITQDEMSATVQDMKIRLNDKAVLKYYNTTDWPNIDDEFADGTKPIKGYYNSRKDIELVCLNKKESNPTHYQYCICAAPDSMHYPKRVSRVYYTADDGSGNDTTFNVSDYTVKIDIKRGIAYISIPYASAIDDSDDPSPREMKADIFGWYNHTEGESEWLNGADMMRDVISLYGGYRYNSTNFNIGNWNIEREKVQRDGWKLSLEVNDETVEDLCKKIAESCRLFRPHLPDQRFDIRYDVETTIPVKVIKKYERLPDYTIGSFNPEDIITSVRITYGDSSDSDKKKTYLDESRKTTISNKRNRVKEASFDRIFADEETSAKYASFYLNRSQEQHPEISLKVPLTSDWDGVSVAQTVVVPSNRSGSENAVYDITALNPSHADGKNQLTLKHRYTLEYADNYIQGMLCGDFICGASLTGVSHYEE